MTRSPSALAQILAGEADLYDELLALLAHEEFTLIAGNTRALAECVARTETLVLKLRCLERSRESLVAELAGGQRVRLAELPGASDDDEVQQARTRLMTTLPRIQRLNHRVSALLERSLSLFRQTLDLIRDAAGLARHYTAAGILVSPAMPTIDGRA